jgi:4-amino-4-deoxy-L-arabinose transferase-like glycosyltransferase
VSSSTTSSTARRLTARRLTTRNTTGLNRWTRLSQWLDLAYWPASILAALAALIFDLKSLLFNASLRYDEINVLASVVDRPYRQLHPPLDYLQSAPVGWLWIEKAVYQVFGRQELPLRATSLIFTAAMFALFIVLARRILSAPAALIAVGLVVTNFYVNFYAYNGKPYSLDLLCTVALALSALAARKAGADPATPEAGTDPAATRTGRTAWILWWSVATLTALLSFTAIFTVAAITLVLVLERAQRNWTSHRPRAAAIATLRFAAGAIPWLVAAGLHYLVALRASSDNDYLYEYFAASFPPKGTGPTAFLNWIGNALYAYSASPLAPLSPYLGLAAMLLGASHLLRRRGYEGAVVLAPVGIGFLLAAATIYPMVQRLGLYSLPLVALAAGSLVDRSYQPVVRLIRTLLARLRWPSTTPATGEAANGEAANGEAAAGGEQNPEAGSPDTAPRSGLRTAAVLGLCWLMLLAIIGKQAVIFRGQQSGRRTYSESRQLLNYVGDRIQPGDVVLASPNSEPAFRFYGPRFKVPQPVDYIMTPSKERTCAPGAVKHELGAASRVWMVFAFPPPNKERAALYQALFRQLGTQSDRLELHYGEATVYDLRSGPRPRPGDTESLDSNSNMACLVIAPRPLPFPPPY